MVNWNYDLKNYTWFVFSWDTILQAIIFKRIFSAEPHSKQHHFWKTVVLIFSTSKIITLKKKRILLLIIKYNPFDHRAYIPKISSNKKPLLKKEKRKQRLSLVFCAFVLFYNIRISKTIATWKALIIRLKKMPGVSWMWDLNLNEIFTWANKGLIIITIKINDTRRIISRTFTWNIKKQAKLFAWNNLWMNCPPHTHWTHWPLS